MHNTTKHTPGPWVAEGDDNGYMIVGPRQCYVADICSADGLANDNNANLIAAAPAMYEALQLAAVMHPHNETFKQALAQAEGKP